MIKTNVDENIIYKSYTIQIESCDNCTNDFDIKESGVSITTCRDCIINNLTDICKINTNKLCNNIKCKNCFYNSLASIDKCVYYYDEHFKTYDIQIPRTITKSNKTINLKFLCECNHIFISNAYNIKTNHWCKVCCKGSSTLCKYLECKSCENRSFKSNDKSKYLVDNVNPRFILKASKIFLNFKCEDCNHIINKSINELYKGKWCKYCNSSYFCEDLNCEFCFNKSFASEEKSKYLIDNVNPRFLTKQSHEEYNFKCNECNHIIKKVLGNIYKGVWCIHCAGRACGNNKCEYCKKNSFASVEKSKYIVDKTINLYIINKHSKLEYEFKCEYNHIFKCRIAHITNGIWCNVCKNKTERKLLDYLTNEFKNYNITFQPKFDWCKNIKTNNYLPFDFLITVSEKIKILIELDGRQHFIKINSWDNDIDNIQERDVYKMKLAINNNYIFIRINQEDIWYNNINLDIIKNLIINISNNIKIKNNCIKNINNIYFISKNLNLYDNHIKLIT